MTIHGIPVAAPLPVRRSRAAAVGRFLAALSAPVLVVAALGHRTGLVPTEAVPPLIALAFALAMAGVAAVVAGAVSVWQGRRRGAPNVLIGLVYAAPAMALIVASLYALLAFPPLNDVSTDLVEPPQFWAVEHPVEPERATRNAAIQARSYPDLTARYYPVGLRLVYDKLKEVLLARGMTLTFDTAPEQTVGGALLEGTERTLLFAFTDDVTCRIAATPDGVRVDIRSVSRLGEHDLGTNARRIRSILRALDDALLGQSQPGSFAAPPASDAQPDASAPPTPDAPSR